MYLSSINYFRGISVIFIVFSHCFDLADFKYESIFGHTLQNVTHGGTTFFVFISGFLFHHIFFNKFEFRGFMIKKIKYTLFPFLILSSISIIYLLVKIFVSVIFSTGSFSNQYEVLMSFPILQHYFWGINWFVGYWYIPFIMIVYAMSPIFVRFIKLRLKPQILTALFLFLCSVYIHRSVFDDYYIFQNILYYTPVYLIGIIVSEKKDIIYSTLTGKEVYILSISLTLALIQALSGKIGNYVKAPFTFGGIDFMIMQKTLLCFFFMIFLNRFENRKLRYLEISAENSFGVFFMHGIVIWFFDRIKFNLDFRFTSNSFITYLLVATIVFILSIIITLYVKRIFPKHSRYLVGC